RAQHTATLLPNGNVLVTGSFPQTNTAEIYNPTTNSWSLAANMKTVRAINTATLLPNGKVLVAGGLVGLAAIATAEIYDPVANTWTLVGTLATQRYIHSATLLPNGTVLVVGGLTAPLQGGQFLSSAEVFDPATNSWRTLGNLATARYRQTATLLS